MLLLTLFAFLAGIVTVLSPCILPLLPIILSSADGTGKQKPLGVVLGFVASFTFFTLFLSSLVRLSGIPAESLRFFSIIVLGVFGASLLMPKVQLQLELWFGKLANLIPTGQQQTGLVGGIVIGLSLGLLWTPCVGPILASVISLALTGTVTTEAFLITLAYALGTAIPMFLIMLAGSTALRRVPWLVKNTKQIQKIFGVLMILTAIGIATNVDRRFQAWVLTTFPNYGVGLTSFEDTTAVQQALNKLSQKPMDETMRGQPLSAVNTTKGVPAPELIQGGQWFNSAPLQLAQLKGKVVLVDFWTYTCINCQRTVPYLKNWWQKYQDQGLVIIGVHSPEFEFEKNPKNLQQAIDDFGLTYPIMQDNQFETWEAYRNRYWPAKYLIDANGQIRYSHFGEGNYDETERMIQQLLKEAGATVDSSAVANPSYRNMSRTPELYLGYARIEHLASPEKITPHILTSFTAPVRLPAHSFAYVGDWTLTPEYAVPSQGAQLQLRFEAKDVFLVARPKNGPAGKIRITLDGELQHFETKDQAGIITIESDSLYQLVKLTVPGSHTLSIEFLDANTEVYAFTFG